MQWELRNGPRCVPYKLGKTDNTLLLESIHFEDGHLRVTGVPSRPVNVPTPVSLIPRSFAIVRRRSHSGRRDRPWPCVLLDLELSADRVANVSHGLRPPENVVIRGTGQLVPVQQPGGVDVDAGCKCKRRVAYLAVDDIALNASCLAVLQPLTVDRLTIERPTGGVKQPVAMFIPVQCVQRFDRLAP